MQILESCALVDHAKDMFGPLVRTTTRTIVWVRYTCFQGLHSDCYVKVCESRQNATELVENSEGAAGNYA